MSAFFLAVGLADNPLFASAYSCQSVYTQIGLLYV
jgi:hypothetical protein